MNIVSLSNGLSWGERATTSGIVSLQGMLTIFLVLSILWATIEIMHRIIHKKPAQEDKPKKAAAPVKAEENPDAAVVAAIAAALAASEDDGATVAAITAAITAMRAEQGCDGAFRVVSFKRVGKNISRRDF